MNRAPLALVYVRSLNEWRAAQTANSLRGCEVEAAILLRPVSDEERTALRVSLGRKELLFDLSQSLDEATTNLLKHWGLPVPGKYRP